MITTKVDDMDVGEARCFLIRVNAPLITRRIIGYVDDVAILEECEPHYPSIPVLPGNTEEPC